MNKVTEWMNLRALFITSRKIKKGTSMKHKYCIFILTAISLLLLTGCGESSKKENVWEPPIEGLTWGMSSEEVKKIYSFIDEAAEKDGTFWVTLEDKIQVYDISMEVSMSFFESKELMLGLQNMTLKCPEEHIGKLEKELEKRFKDTADPTTDEYGWISWVTGEVISDYYTAEQLKEAYTKRLGEEYMSAHSDYYNGYIAGLPRSYLASYQLKYKGEDSGFMEINGVRLAEMKYLFGEDWKIIR